MPLLKDRNKTLEYDPNSIFRASKYITNISSANLGDPSKNPNIVSKSSKQYLDTENSVSDFIGMCDEVNDLFQQADASIGDIAGEFDIAPEEFPSRGEKEVKIRSRGSVPEFSFMKNPDGTFVGSGRKISRQKRQSLESALSSRDSAEMKRMPKRRIKKPSKIKPYEDSLFSSDKQEADEHHEIFGGINFNKAEGPRFTARFENRPELVIKAFTPKDRIYDQGLTTHLKPFEQTTFKTQGERQTYEIGTEGEHKIGGMSGGATTRRPARDDDIPRSDSESDDEERGDGPPPKFVPPRAGPNLYPGEYKPYVPAILTNIATKIAKLHVFFKSKIKKNINDLDEKDIKDIEERISLMNNLHARVNNGFQFYGFHGYSIVDTIDKRMDSFLIDVMAAIKSWAPKRRGAGFSGGAMQGMPRSGFNSIYNNCPTKYLL